MVSWYSAPLPALSPALKAAALRTIAATAATLLLAPAAAHAHGKAHVHGVASLDVAIEAGALTVSLEAPLDSLLGFEHRPRTDAQRRAAAALLRQLQESGGFIKPPAAAQCAAPRISVDAQALEPAAASAVAAGKDAKDAHSDISVSWTFTCGQPQQIGQLELGLFETFKRLQRIDARIAGDAGQASRTLKRPQKTLALKK